MSLVFCLFSVEVDAQRSFDKYILASDHAYADYEDNYLDTLTNADTSFYVVSGLSDVGQLMFSIELVDTIAGGTADAGDVVIQGSYNQHSSVWYPDITDMEIVDGNLDIGATPGVVTVQRVVNTHGNAYRLRIINDTGDTYSFRVAVKWIKGPLPYPVSSS